MFLLQRGKEPGSFRFLFLHGDRQRRSFGAEFPDLYRFCLKRRDPRIGYPDHFRRHRVVRNLHLAADQGRCRLIFPALEADTCSLVYQPGFVGGEMLPPLRWYQGMSGDGCPFPIPASVRSPGREQGCPGFRNTHGSLHGLLVIILFQEDPPVLVQLFQCPNLMRFCFPQIRIYNLMEFFTFAFRFPTRPRRMADCDPKFPRESFSCFAMYCDPLSK